VGPGIRRIYEQEMERPDGIHTVRTVQGELERAVYRLTGRGLPHPYRRIDFKVDTHTHTHTHTNTYQDTYINTDGLRRLH
jgi:hypothetical protein